MKTTDKPEFIRLAEAAVNAAEIACRTTSIQCVAGMSDETKALHDRACDGAWQAVIAARAALNAAQAVVEQQEWENHPLRDEPWLKGLIQIK